MAEGGDSHKETPVGEEEEEDELNKSSGSEAEMKAKRQKLQSPSSNSMPFMVQRK